MKQEELKEVIRKVNQSFEMLDKSLNDMYNPSEMKSDVIYDTDDIDTLYMYIHEIKKEIDLFQTKSDE